MYLWDTEDDGIAERAELDWMIIEGDTTRTDLCHHAIRGAIDQIEHHSADIRVLPLRRIGHGDFLRWVEKEEYVRPKFWGDALPLAAEAPQPAPKPAQSAAEKACRQLLNDGVEPGGGDCSWAQFQQKVKRAIAPSTKGISKDNLKKIVGKLRGTRR
jgi:hypothetical protein